MVTKKLLDNTSVVNISILVLLAVYLIYALYPVLDSIFSFILDVSIPFVLALVFYYLLRPLVSFLSKKISIYPAIALSYLMVALIMMFLVLFVYPVIAKQVSLLQAYKFSDFLEIEGANVTFFKTYHVNFNLPEGFKTTLEGYLGDLNAIVIQSVSNFFSILTKFVVAIVIAPFICFYFLKEDHKIYNKAISLVPEKHLSNAKRFCTEVDTTLTHFIIGRIIIAAITSLILFVTFLAVGLNFSFVLAFIAFFFYIIPSIGSFLAMILPMIVAFTMGGWMWAIVLVILFLAMGLEGLVITPQVMGQHLYMHPLTTIFFLLAGGYLFGLFGLLFATPVYVIMKILLSHLFEVLRKEKITASV